MASSSSSSPFDREKSVYIAKLAEEAGRYQDVVKEMTLVAEMVGELTDEEMSLLTTGYSNVIVSLRDCWRTLTRKAEMEELKGNEAKVEQIIAYRHKLETKITHICHDYLSVVNQHLGPRPQEYIFYLKKKADYHRYLAEIKTGSERQEAADESLLTYRSASENARAELAAADPIRLGIDLNLAMFYDAILGNTERALQIATNAVYEAVPDSRLSEEEYADSTKILRVLGKNIKKWNGGSSQDTAFAEDIADIPEYEELPATAFFFLSP